MECIFYRFVHFFKTTVCPSILTHRNALLWIFFSYLPARCRAHPPLSNYSGMLDEILIPKNKIQFWKIYAHFFLSHSECIKFIFYKKIPKNLAEAKHLQKLPHWNRAETDGNLCKFFASTQIFMFILIKNRL